MSSRLHRVLKSSSSPVVGALLCGAVLLVAQITARGAGWEETVPPYTPGNFPEPRNMRAQYGFSWNGAGVASAQLRFHRVDDQFVLEGTVQTSGLARSLWPFDAQQTSVTDARTLRPIRVKEAETRRSKQLETEVNYTPERAVGRRVETKDGKTKNSDRSFDFPNAMSLNSALLYLRSRPLADGAVERIVVYPGRTAYLCTVTVLGHDHLSVPAGSYDAIKCDVKLSKIGDDRQLKPHKKFKRATVWLSNDADRLLLRIESQIFIGSVSAQLESVQFDNAKP